MMNKRVSPDRSVHTWVQLTTAAYKNAYQCSICGAITRDPDTVLWTCADMATRKRRGRPPIARHYGVEL